MLHFSVLFLGLCSLLSLFLFFRAGSDVSNSLSPQGCRMSWMSPSYVLQSAFDHSWSPLASRYSLYLYREVGWDPPSKLYGSPVLFIPGNAGSSHQVRSIASSATRQFFSSPYHVSADFEHEHHDPLDFFALEFNEDLSAFHGPTLDAETSYARAAISYILSLYPPSPQSRGITILGHSMGGIVATALLPHPNVSALITMSTPHTLPPARLDRRIDAIYASNRKILATDPTPILSLCGGATDLQVPAESCVLPASEWGTPQNGTAPYRQTVFTSALEGAWTGVGHREMVWCHQVRWRIARAAIELAGAWTSLQRALVLDRWLRDGHTLPPLVEHGLGAPDDVLDLDALREDEVEYLDPSAALVLSKPTRDRTYVLPVLPPAGPPAEAREIKFTLYVSHGSVLTMRPQHSGPLDVVVYQCPSSSAAIPQRRCTPLAPTTLKLIPEPVPGRPFPVPDEGSDEGEGVVVYTAIIPHDLTDTRAGGGAQPYIAVQVKGTHGEGWITGGFSSADTVISDTGVLGLMLASAKVALSGSAVHKQVSFPNLLSNGLIVYRLSPVLNDPYTCVEAQLPPLLEHTSHPSETHYYPLLPFPNDRPILLHSHASGPFIASSSAPWSGFNITIHSSNDRPCAVVGIDVSLDWWGTLGRWGVRYAQAVLAWGIGICAFLLYQACAICDTAGSSSIPAVGAALAHFASYTLSRLLPLTIVISLVPHLPPVMWLGNGGKPEYAIIAPILLATTGGLVCVVYGVLSMSVNAMGWVIKKVGRGHRPREDTRLWNVLLSMGLIFVLIFVFVPWQVAFLGAWVYHFYTCAIHAASSTMPTASRAIPLVPRRSSPSRETGSLSGSETSSSPPSSSPIPKMLPSSSPADDASVLKQNLYLLLLMTWMIPITAPVLAVWVRTVAGAGVQAVWGSGSGWVADRNVLAVAPWLVAVEFAGSCREIFSAATAERPYSQKFGFVAVAFASFFFGPRKLYIIFEGASFAVLLAAAIHAWGGRRRPVREE